MYHSFGKTAMNLSSFEKGFRGNTSLDFYYHGLEYYLPISNKAFPDFLYTSKDGDTLYIDIVAFDTIYPYGYPYISKAYYSYINRIRRKE